MKSDKKLIKIKTSEDLIDKDSESSEKIGKDLDHAVAEHKKVTQLINYFVLGLFLAFLLFLFN